MTNEQWMQLYLQAWVEVGYSRNNRIDYRYWANLPHNATHMAVVWHSPKEGYLSFF